MDTTIMKEQFSPVDNIIFEAAVNPCVGEKQRVPTEFFTKKRKSKPTGFNVSRILASMPKPECIPDTPVVVSRKAWVDTPSKVYNDAVFTWKKTAKERKDDRIRATKELKSFLRREKRLLKKQHEREVIAGEVRCDITNQVIKEVCSVINLALRTSGGDGNLTKVVSNLNKDEFGIAHRLIEKLNEIGLGVETQAGLFSMDHGIAEGSQDFLNQVMNTIKEISDKVLSAPIMSGNINITTPIDTTFKGMYDSMADCVKTMNTPLLICVLLAVVLSYYAFRTVTGVVLKSVVSAISSMLSFIPGYDDVISLFSTPQAQVEAQVGTDTCYKLASGACLVLYWLIFGKTCPDNVVSGFIEDCTILKKIQLNFDWSVNTIISLFQAASDFVCSCVWGGKWCKAASEYPRLVEIMDEVDAISLSLTKSNTPINVDLAGKIFSLRKDVREHSSIVPKTHCEAWRLQVLTKAIDNLIMATKGAFQNKDFRMAPLAVMFVGQPGVGKTTAIDSLIQDALAYILPPEYIPQYVEEPLSTCYVAPAGSEFFDDYNNQPVWVMNEVFHVKDDGTNCGGDMAKFVLQILDTAPVQLPQADLSRKGTAYANPSLVFLTSNQTRFDEKTMSSFICPEAMRRRVLELGFMVVPKVEFSYPGYTNDIRTRRLDKSKVNGPYLDVNDFHRLTPDGLPLATSMTYNEVLDLIIKSFRDKKDSHAKLNCARDAKRSERVATMLATRNDLPPELRGSIETALKRKADEVNTTLADRALVPVTETDVLREKLLRAMTKSPPGTQTWGQWFDAKVASGLVSTTTTFAELCSMTEELWEDVLKPVRDYMSFGKTYALQCAAGFATGFLLTKAAVLLLNLFTKPDTQSGDTKQSKRQQKRTKAIRFTRGSTISKPPISGTAVIPAPVYTEGGIINKAIADTCQGLIKNNMYLIEFQTNEPASYKIGYGIVVCDTSMIMPHHFACDIYDKLESFPLATIRMKKPYSNTGWTQVPATVFLEWVRDVVDHDGTNVYDMVSVTLPSSLFQSSPDIRSKFVSKDENMFKGYSFNAILPLDRGGVSLILADIQAIVTNGFSYQPYLNPLSFTYSIQTTVGDCGAPLVCNDSRYPSLLGKIVGFHVAGTPKYLEDGTKVNILGYSNHANVDLLGLTSVTECERKISSALKPVSVTPIEYITLNSGIANGNVVARCVNVMRAKSTKIKRTKLHGCIGELKMAPARLAPFSSGTGMVDPFHVAMSGFRSDKMYIPEILLSDVTRHLTCRYVGLMGLCERPNLTAEEAVRGWGNLSMIPRKTSLGLPDKLMAPAGVSGKRHIMGTDGPVDVTTEAMKQHISDVGAVIKQILDGKSIVFPFQPVLKDEILAQEKVDIGKSRLIFCSSFTFLTLCRMYYGELVSKMADDKFRLLNDSAVGINVYNSFGQLAEYHEKMNPKGSMDCDYKSFDKTQNRQILMSNFDNFDAFYSRFPVCPVRKWIRSTICQATMCFDGLLVDFDGGNPSGQPLTTMINGFSNTKFIYMALIDQEVDMFDYATGDVDIEVVGKNLRLTTYGDDVILTLSEQYKHITCTNLNRSLTKIGVNLTNGDKTDAATVTIPLKSIYECEFLKRSIKKLTHKGRTIVTCPLAMKSILKGIYFSENDECSEFGSNIQLQLYEIALHGERIFNENAPTIVQQYACKYLQTIADTTFDACLEKALHLDGYQL